VYKEISPKTINWLLSIKENFSFFPKNFKVLADFTPCLHQNLSVFCYSNPFRSVFSRFLLVPCRFTPFSVNSRRKQIIFGNDDGEMIETFQNCAVLLIPARPQKYFILPNYLPHGFSHYDLTAVRQAVLFDFSKKICYNIYRKLIILVVFIDF